MSDIEREQALKDHVEWCRQERDRAAEKLRLIEAGAIKRHHASDDGEHLDTTEDYKAELEHVVDKMSRILFAFAPR